MPILFVNGKRRGLRVKGRARVGAKRRARRATVRAWPPPGYAGMPASARRVGRRNPAKGARKGKNGRWVSAKSIAALAAYNRKRRGKARRSTSMAKGSRKRSRAMKAYWRKRKASGKQGGLGRTKRVKRRKPAKRRRTRARRTHRTKRARRSRRRTRHATATRRTRKRRRSRMATKTYRRRVKQAQSLMGGPNAVTLRMNPSRRRRRKRRTGAHRRRRTTHRRRARRTRHRSYRRYSRRYRRNPIGGDLMALLKEALPVVGGFYASRLLVGMVGPMIPGVSALGTLSAPVLSAAAVIGGNWAAKRFAPAHRSSINMGTAVQLIDSVVRAFAPASVKTMIGMSDYVQMGDYVAVGAVPPLRENFTLSDYIAVGGDGVEQELGLEEELGVEEELGATDGYMGGLPGGARLLAPVPTQSFVTPIPARSFTKMIPAAGTSYDAQSDLYGGIFGGRFGGG